MATKPSNVVLNFKMEGQVEYAKTIREINAIMNTAAKEYKNHVAAMGDDAKATDKLVAEKKKLEIQMDAAKKRTEMLRAEYEAMSKSTKTTTGQLTQMYGKLLDAEKAEASLKKSLERVNEGLSDQAIETRKAQDELNNLADEMKMLELEQRKLSSSFDLQNASLSENASEVEKVELAQKQLRSQLQLSQKVVGTLEKQLDAAKKAYGENSREVIELETKLNGARTTIQKFNKQLDSVEDSSKKASKGLDGASNAMQALAGAVPIAAIIGLAESTRELATDLARLKTNAHIAGRDLEIVNRAFKQTASVSGEADSAVETLSNILASGFKDEQLSEVIDNINGAAIRFSDTLKTEGIADGIQETFATGKAIGPFAELLERSGIVLEEFNEGLAKAQEKGEGANYILQTMSSLGLTDVLNKYKELNPEIVAANEAQVEQEIAMAELGNTIRPLVTEVAKFTTEIINWANENPTLTQTLGVATAAIGAFATAAALMSGPAGWVTLAAAAVGGLAIGLAELYDQSNLTTDELIKLQEEVFEDTVAAYDQAKAVNELATEYGDLREKSKLTTEQMLEFIALQNEIANTTSPDKLKELKERASELETASGLTNIELGRMIQLDSDLQDNVEGVKLSFDEKGNAVISYKDKLVEATNAQLELAKAELENEMLDNLFAMQESYEKIAIAAKEKEKAYNQSLKHLDEYNSALDKQKDFEKDIKALLVEIDKMEENKSNYTKDQIRAKHDLLAEMNTELLYLKDDTDYYKQQYELHQGIYEEQTKEIANLNQQIVLTENQYDQYLDILAAEVDIVGEQGKQLQQMRNKYNENAKEISQLETKLRTEGKLSEKEQGRLNKLREQQKQLQNNIGEAEELNEILGEDITKQLTIDDGGRIREINSDLSKAVTKYVNIVESRKPTLAPAYADGTNYHPGGPAIVGEEGIEIGEFNGKQYLLGLSGTELWDLPQGFKVIPNHELSAIPDGAIFNRPAIFGESGRSFKSSNQTIGERGVVKGDGITQNITIVSPDPTSPSENARKFEQVQRKLAMEW